MTVTDALLKMAVGAAESNGASRVTKITIKIGEMTHLNRDSVEYYFALMSEGTPAEGASLEIEEIPLRASCGQCGADFDASGVRLTCPECGSTKTSITAGREMYLDSVEVE